MNISMKITAHKDEVLSALRKNREEHQTIVAEAREGYVKKAREALTRRLNQLESGKLAGLQFSLVVPTNYTKEYDAAIRMLELHEGDTVELDAPLVRCLVLNEWDWMSFFIGSSSQYSSTAARMSESE